MAQCKAGRKPKTHSIPITGLFLFVSETKAEVEGQNPGLTRLEIFTMLNSRWAQLDAATREKYERKADYSRRTESRRKLLAHRKESRGSPRQHVSAYSVFLRRQHEQLKQTDPDLTVSQRAQTIGELWRTMPKSDKIPFVNEAKRETRKLRKVAIDEDDPESL
jgi:hypothetical protein